MWAPDANQITSPVELTVFTYDEDDFDELGHYRGISKNSIMREYTHGFTHAGFNCIIAWFKA